MIRSRYWYLKTYSSASPSKYYPFQSLLEPCQAFELLPHHFGFNDYVSDTAACVDTQNMLSCYIYLTLAAKYLMVSSDKIRSDHPHRSEPG